MYSLPFSTLLYRYFFFNWLFRDVRVEDRYQRLMALRHNRKQAVWLPTYMKRWLVTAMLFYAAGGLAELVLHAPVLVKFLYAFSAVSVALFVTTSTVWVALAQREEEAVD